MQPCTTPWRREPQTVQQPTERLQGCDQETEKKEVDAIRPLADEKEGDGWRVHEVLKEARVQRRDRCVHPEGSKVKEPDDAQASAVCQEREGDCAQEEAQEKA